MQNPLVSERLELSVLYKEYAEDDNIYQQKIKVGAWPGGRSRRVPASDVRLAGLAAERVGCQGRPLVAGSRVWNQKDFTSDPDCHTAAVSSAGLSMFAPWAPCL